MLLSYEVIFSPGILLDLESLKVELGPRESSPSVGSVSHHTAWRATSWRVHWCRDGGGQCQHAIPGFSGGEAG